MVARQHPAAKINAALQRVVREHHQAAKLAHDVEKPRTRPSDLAIVSDGSDGVLEHVSH